MTSTPGDTTGATIDPAGGDDTLLQARLNKLTHWREAYGITGYGNRVDDLVSLADARALFDEQAHETWTTRKEAGKDSPDDPRPEVRVWGRCMQHRAMGKLTFIVLRDSSGDLQASISKADVSANDHALAQKIDYGDILVVEGRMGQTRKGEVCVWASSVEVHCKSLSPPPEKYHGLHDPETRYRRRYLDMYVNPDTVRTFALRSRIVSAMRRFLDQRGFLEVETPMMHPVTGGAAARPFTTHHHALDIPLYLRIAPELYLKRLLVGGMPRVYEVNRSFRNEGIDRSHNPEFTSLEVYEAFGNCETMRALTQDMLCDLARSVAGSDANEPCILPWGEHAIDWTPPFEQIEYAALFEAQYGFDMTNEDAVRTRAADDGLKDPRSRDHWLLVEELFDRSCEDSINPSRPTFVTDFPSAVSPLTRPHEDAPHLCGRWDLYAGGFELGTAYTELNDPMLQRERFTEQLAGIAEEDASFRALDEDFLDALEVGMPPAGGVGIGVDRVVMLLANRSSIRDVILFPLLRPAGGGEDPAGDS